MGNNSKKLRLELYADCVNNRVDQMEHYRGAITDPLVTKSEHDNMDDKSQVNERYVGVPALHIACHLGHFELVKELVERRKAPVNQRIEEVVDGCTPFLMAALAERDTVAEYLISMGANADQMDNDGFCASHIAGQFGFLGIMKAVARAGVDVDRVARDFSTPLYLAAQENRLEVVRFLVESGNVVVDRVTDEGMSALTIAAKKGHFSVVQFLVEKGGANVNLVDNSKMSVLHRACSLSDDNSKIVQYLIDHGANPNTVNSRGQSPLISAVRKEFEKICMVLINAKVPTFACEANNFNPPLAYSADIGITRMLLHHGARVNEKLPTGAPMWTTLIQEEVSLDVLHLLKELGADFTEQFQGNSALYRSIKEQCYSSAKFFAQLGVKLWRDTSARSAVKQLLDDNVASNEELMDLLWEQGLPIEVTDFVPKTVMSIRYTFNSGSTQSEGFVGVKRVAGLVRMIREYHNVPPLATLEYCCDSLEKESYMLQESTVLPTGFNVIPLSIKVVQTHYTIRQNRLCDVTIETKL